jgi:hypothetical protein
MNLAAHVRKICLAIFAIGVPLLISACKDEIVTPGQNLAEARALWAATGPTTYTMTIHLACECGNGPVVIRVKKGVVESRRYVSSGELVTPQYVPLYPTVDELFAFIAARIDSKPTMVHAEYDANTGYPVRVEVPGIDQQDVWTVTLLGD